MLTEGAGPPTFINQIAIRSTSSSVISHFSRRSRRQYHRRTCRRSGAAAAARTKPGPEAAAGAGDIGTVGAVSPAPGARAMLCQVLDWRRKNRRFASIGRRSVRTSGHFTVGVPSPLPAGFSASERFRPLSGLSGRNGREHAGRSGCQVRCIGQATHQPPPPFTPRPASRRRFAGPASPN